jgi:hypothetical protein
MMASSGVPVIRFYSPTWTAGTWENRVSLSSGWLLLGLAGVGKGEHTSTLGMRRRGIAHERPPRLSRDFYEHIPEQVLDLGRGEPHDGDGEGVARHSPRIEA